MSAKSNSEKITANEKNKHYKHSITHSQNLSQSHIHSSQVNNSKPDNSQFHQRSTHTENRHLDDELFESDPRTSNELLSPTLKPVVWIPDHLSDFCCQCGQPWTFTRRRHHCRFVVYTFLSR